MKQVKTVKETRKQFYEGIDFTAVILSILNIKVQYLNTYVPIKVTNVVWTVFDTCLRV